MKGVSLWFVRNRWW